MRKTFVFLLFVMTCSGASAQEWRRIALPGVPAGRSGAAVASTGDGGLFVFGGLDSGAPMGDAWLFRPDGKAWSRLADGPVAVSQAAAVHVGNGRVLLFGGDDGRDVTDAFLQYDMTTGAWGGAPVDPASGRPGPRRGHGMAWDGEDSVLLFGGDGGDAGLLDDTWVYRISRRAWTRTAPGADPSPRREFGLSPAGGGKVLLFGGEDDWGLADDLWEFDFAAGEWALRNVGGGGNGPSPRRGHAFLRAADRLVLFGGAGDGGLLADSWDLDPADAKWRPIPERAVGIPGRAGAGIAAAAAGKVLLFGGKTDAGPDNGAWEYDADARRWAPVLVHESPRPREGADLAPADGNAAVLIGGAAPVRSFTGEVWMLDAASGTWTRRSDVPRRLSGCAPSGGSTGTDRAARLGAGSVAVVTARVFAPSDPCSMTFLPGTRWLNCVQLLSMPDGVWSETLFRPAAATAAADAAPTLRHDYAVAPDGDRGIVLFGGTDGAPLGDTWRLDGASLRWSLLWPAVSPGARVGHAMASLGRAGVFLFGGLDAAGGRRRDSWLFDPRTGQWRALSPAGAPPARSGHSLVALDSSRVLLFGGFDGERTLNDAWIFDLAADAWKPLGAAAGASPPARMNHAMTLTEGGLVLLFGGRADPGDEDSLLRDAWALDVTGIR